MEPCVCAGEYLRGADETTLVFTPVHTQHLVSVTLQDTLGLYWQLTHHFHLLSHLVHWDTHTHRHTQAGEKIGLLHCKCLKISQTWNIAFEQFYSIRMALTCISTCFGNCCANLDCCHYFVEQIQPFTKNFIVCDDMITSPDSWIFIVNITVWCSISVA